METVKERYNGNLDILDKEDDEAVVINTTVVNSHKLRTDRETSGSRREKPVFRGLRTTQAQTSLRTRAV